MYNSSKRTKATSYHAHARQEHDDEHGDQLPIRVEFGGSVCRAPSSNDDKTDTYCNYDTCNHSGTFLFPITRNAGGLLI